MATRLYFTENSVTLANPPLSEQSTATPDTTAVGYLVLNSMQRTTGGAIRNHTISSLATTTTQYALFKLFASPALVSNTTISADTLTWNVADQESNAASNFWVGALNLYVWRPSTGTKVGTLVDNVTGTQLGTEGGTSITVTTGTIATNSVSALAGDVLICEVWSNFTQSMGTSYTNNFYFNGTTVTTVENTVVTDHASFLELTQNLLLVGDPQTLTQSSLFTNSNTLYSHTLSQPGNRYSYPASDISVGAWTTDTNGTTNLYQSVDENAPGSDTDYVKTTTSGSVYSFNLSGVADPLTSSEQIVRIRARSSTSNSLTATLKQGATVIATRTFTGVSSTFTEYNIYLSVAECNAITNYSGLSIELSGA